MNDKANVLKVLPEPEAKFNVPLSHDIISYIADTLLLTNASSLTVMSTPLLLIFDKPNVRKGHVYTIEAYPFIFHIGILIFHASIFRFRCCSV